MEQTSQDPDPAARRDRLRQMIEEIPPPQLPTAEKFLAALVASSGPPTEQSRLLISEGVRLSLQNAREAMTQGQWGDALVRFDAALAMEPDLGPRVLPLRSTCLVRAGYPSMAARAIRAASRDGYTPGTLRALGKLMAESEVYDLATELFQALLEREPDNAENRTLLDDARTRARKQTDPVLAAAASMLAPGITGLELHASGGMAMICTAFHKRLGRRVAVKILMPRFYSSEFIVERFLLEAVSLINLQHPNLVEGISFLREPGLICYTMEFFDGATSAASLLKAGKKFGWKEALKTMIHVADALGALHRKGIVHRDVNPENILILPDGRVKLIDLSAATFGTFGRGELTAFTGALRYSPQEGLTQEIQSPSLDVYSLAVTFHDLVCGLPKGKEVVDPAQFVTQILFDLDTRGVPDILCRRLLRCLEHQPAKRFPSGDALREELCSIDLSDFGLTREFLRGPVLVR